ncbi:hypothetical protein LTR35_010386 [Friedmanniomyces endolithicus]|uniref:NADP-dependent oxidoreductase domain-containing protein n=1 Tax=Friedmanniomyces endolithicus TaxID=329885 RepID=A0AAN6JCW8_9PEZI|nr:hypothetical protein LTR35_010386 [Friedmanniomyces endolithicus]KAK0294241.1 hypothetical protein LTS00_007216 [Friedmanniomyces endolithicus]KAK0325461.1 hypothetical protein LTR82_003744 [Friedmanniomyces endolithicus]KAK1003297.1 hypothetical protein LTR54_007810 [Friedmanniomyces endolithicus]
MRLTTAVLPLAASAFALQHHGVQIPLEPSTAIPSGPFTLDTIPLLGFGTWNLKGDNVSEAVSWAIQTGYRHIDCAAAYGNEKEVGKGIADGLLKTGLKREDLWITSKLWNDQYIHHPILSATSCSPHHSHGTTAPQTAIDTTLRNLGLTYLDLYHMHWPVSQSLLHKNTIEYLPTWSSMVLLHSKGLARHIGISNFSPAQLRDLLAHTSIPPYAHQMELHPYLQQSEWLAFHEEHGIKVTAYSPLAGSNPTYGSYPEGLEPLLNNTVLREIGEKRGCTPAQVALAWGMGRGTSVIPKSQHKERIEEDFGSLECGLEEGDVEMVDGLGVVKHRFNNPSEDWKVELYEGLEGV